MSGERPTTLEQAYRQLRNSFRAADLAEPELDARVLVSAVASLEPKDLILHYDRPVSEAQLAQLSEFESQRLAGKPVGRILGTRQFWGLEFSLNEATLEPRPDTEVLVEEVLEICTGAGTTNAPLVFADIGTGTGAIAISLLTELPNAIVVAVDISERALEAATQNAEMLGVGDRFFPVRCNYTDALSGPFDFIVSNPPYIRSEVIEELSQEVRNHDPMMALDGGADGLVAYRRLISSCRKLLKPKGHLSVEIGWDQAQDLVELAENEGVSSVSCRKDLGGNDRVVTIVYP